jgi:hypothetical protein
MEGNDTQKNYYPLIIENTDLFWKLRINVCGACLSMYPIFISVYYIYYKQTYMYDDGGFNCHCQKEKTPNVYF